MADPMPPAPDALLPADMARRAEALGVAKATMPPVQMVVLGVLAGAFIGLGAMLSTVVTASPEVPFAVGRLLGGLVFSLGLILVVVGGAELFTGNTLIVMALASRRLRLVTVGRAWAVVYLANFVGAIATAATVAAAGHDEQGGGLVGQRMVAIAMAKCSLGFGEAVLLGVLANSLVCLAVWMTLAARSVTDKVLVVILPVTAFVAAGFEHSVANMYLIPAGLVARSWGADELTAAPPGADPDALDWRAFLVDNLVPVTLGNLIGGAVLVGLVYWAAYLRPRRPDGVTSSGA